MPGAAGAQRLTWQEIESWSRASATPLQPWEAEMIRNLSAEWVVEERRAEDPKAPAPYMARLTRAEVAARIDEVFARK